MTFQDSFEVSTLGRGISEITAEVTRIVRAAKIERGIAHVFAQHTSCSVIITENADPTVRNSDLEMLAQRWAPDGDAEYHHDTEGNDDMAAHARSLLTGYPLLCPSPTASYCSAHGREFTCGNTARMRITRRIVVTVTDSLLRLRTARASPGPIKTCALHLQISAVFLRNIVWLNFPMFYRRPPWNGSS